MKVRVNKSNDRRRWTVVLRAKIKKERLARRRRKALASVPARMILTKDQVQKLIDAADPQIRPTIMATALMGLRASEVGHVDWGHPIRRGRRLWVAVPCLKQRRRKLKVIPTKFWAEITKLQPEHRARALDLARSALDRSFRRSAEDAGNHDTRLHDLRRHWLSQRTRRTR